MKPLLPLIIIGLFVLRWQSLPSLNLKEGQRVRLTGNLAQEPEAKDNRQSFKIGRIRVITERYPEYHYGNRLKVVGSVRVQGRNYQLNYPQVTLVADRTGGGVKGAAIELNQKLKGIYGRCFPTPLDGIVSGVVLGDKSLISTEFWQELQATGTLHIMVASGMNIALIAGSGLSVLTLLFRRRLAIIFLFIMIWFYSLMTGFTPPIVRAALMSSLVFLGQLFGREAQGGKILLTSGLVMFLVDPRLLFDIGFQLSFLATAGLIYIQPILSQSRFWLWRQENFASSLGAQLMTLPVLVYNFGQLNLASPLINLAVLWLIPLILQAGIVVGILGLLWIRLGEMVSYLLYPGLVFIKQIVSLSAKGEIFQIQVAFSKNIFWLIFYYLLLFFWIKKSYPKTDPK